VKIPAQPRVLDELRKLMLRKEMDVRPLARVINQDPGLAAMLFKVVGNSAYRQHQPFDSVEEILHAVGTRQTFNLVQAISLSGLGEIKKNRQVYEAFWARSHTIAQLAMLIADERQVCNILPDQAYLAGIFHDCGVPLLMQRFPAYCNGNAAGHSGAVDRSGRGRPQIQRRSLRGRLSGCPPLASAGIHLRCHPLSPRHRRTGAHAARSMVAILQLAIEIYFVDQQIPNPGMEGGKDEVLPELGLNEDALPELIDIVLERFMVPAVA
jgi:hypothetical protein